MSDEVYSEEEIAIVKEWTEFAADTNFDQKQNLYKMADLGLAQIKDDFPQANNRAWDIRRSLYKDRKWTPEEFSAVENFMDEPNGSPRKAALGREVVQLGLGRFSPSGKAAITGFGRRIQSQIMQWRM